MRVKEYMSDAHSPLNRAKDRQDEGRRDKLQSASTAAIVS